MYRYKVHKKWFKNQVFKKYFSKIKKCNFFRALTKRFLVKNFFKKTSTLEIWPSKSSRLSWELNLEVDGSQNLETYFECRYWWLGARKMVLVSKSRFLKVRNPFLKSFLCFHMTFEELWPFKTYFLNIFFSHIERYKKFIFNVFLIFMIYIIRLYDQFFEDFTIS